MAREAKVGPMVMYKSLVETPRDPYHCTLESQTVIKLKSNPNAQVCPEVVACQTPLVCEVDLDTVYFDIFDKASVVKSNESQLASGKNQSNI